jgi:serine/threonine protein kinase
VDTLDNKYQIEQLLGKGGMGAVYRPTHLGTKRTVAVKVIHPQLSAHDFTTTGPKQVGFNFSMSGPSALYQLLNVFVTPITAIMPSLLYLKTRKAGGESLRDASEQFDALDIPRSKWQQRMKKPLDHHAPANWYGKEAVLVSKRKSRWQQ